LSDGEVVIDITGGTAPYVVNGLEISGSQFVAGTLSEGNYNFNVTDATAQMTSADVTLVSPPELIVQAIVNNVTSYGGANGSVDLTIVNGTATYGWFTQDGSGVNSTVEDQSGLRDDISSADLTSVWLSYRNRIDTSSQPTLVFNCRIYAASILGKPTICCGSIHNC